jgi:hypothetical protein
LSLDQKHSAAEPLKRKDRGVGSNPHVQFVVDKLEALLDVGLGLGDLLLEQHGADELVDLGVIAHEVQLLLDHVVLVGLLRVLLALRREHLHLCTEQAA